MIKPDGVQRGLIGKIIQRFESKGFKLVSMKYTWASEDLVKQHYAQLANRSFFAGLVKYITSGPVVPMVWEGQDVVKTARVMMGVTDPAEAAPGTIRGDFSVQIGRNVLHGANAVEAAKKEIALWFKDEDLVNWQQVSSTLALLKIEKVLLQSLAVSF
jgi:nucleoside-diphosphate kinase